MKKLFFIAVFLFVATGSAQAQQSLLRAVAALQGEAIGRISSAVMNGAGAIFSGSEEQKRAEVLAEQDKQAEAIIASLPVEKQEEARNQYQANRTVNFDGIKKMESSAAEQDDFATRFARKQAVQAAEMNGAQQIAKQSLGKDVVTNDIVEAGKAIAGQRDDASQAAVEKVASADAGYEALGARRQVAVRERTTGEYVVGGVVNTLKAVFSY